MGLEYVDIFYSHRFDPDTPLEETIGALDTAVRSGQGAVRRHLVLLAPSARAEAVEIARSLGTPILIHQPSLLAAQPLDRARGARHLRRGRARASSPSRRSARACSPTATSAASPRTRARRRTSTSRRTSSTRRTWRACAALNEIAQRRGQKLAQMALAWVLRDPRVTSRADRRVERRAARDQRRRARQPRVHRRGAGRDRPARGRRRHQHLGAVERTRERAARSSSSSSRARRWSGISGCGWSRSGPTRDARAAVPARARDDGRHRPRRRDREPDRHRRRWPPRGPTTPSRSRSPGSTVTLNVNYVAAARGQDLTAHAVVGQARAQPGLQRRQRDRAGRAARRDRLGRAALGRR